MLKHTYLIGTGGSGGKAAVVWNWPLTFV